MDGHKREGERENESECDNESERVRVRHRACQKGGSAMTGGNNAWRKVKF